MSTSILPSNKSNIVTYRKRTNNGDSDRDSSVNSGGNSNGVNEGYGAKMTSTQDESQIKHMY